MKVQKMIYGKPLSLKQTHPKKNRLHRHIFDLGQYDASTAFHVLFIQSLFSVIYRAIDIFAFHSLAYLVTGPWQRNCYSSHKFLIKSREGRQLVYPSNV